MVIFFLGSLIILLAQMLRWYKLTEKISHCQRLQDKREKELSYLSLLIEFAVTDHSSIKSGFTKLLNTLKETVGWSYHSVFRLDEEQQILVIRFTGYLPKWYMEKLSTELLIKVGDASVGRAVATKQPVTINLANQDPRFKHITPLDKQTGYQSLSCYPMIGRIKTHGGFCTYSSRNNIFTVHDTQFFMTCANLYAAVLENKLLEKAAPAGDVPTEPRKDIAADGS